MPRFTFAREIAAPARPGARDDMSTCFRFAASLTLAAAVAAAALAGGCAEREPVTVLFTGDEHGRLVPAG